MDQSTATPQPSASLLPSGVGAITTVHLVLVVLVAVAAIAIIIVGIRRQRLRAEAARQVERHAREAGVASAAPASEPTPAAAPIAREPAPAADEPADNLLTAPVAPPVDQPINRSANEPIAAAAPLEANPATIAADEVGPSPSLSPADGPVTQLKGLGPKVAARLAEFGVTRVGQIAALDDDAAAALDAQLGAFAGRLTRDRWIEQARFLAAGDRAGFEAVFGRL